MYDYGEKYKSLCEANCRRYKAYLDIYKKSTDSEGNETYTYSKTVQSYGSAESIVSIKIVRGQTTGSFSFGNSYSGEMTVVITAKTEIGKSGDKIIPSVSFIDDEGNETEKAPLGMFFISTIAQNDYTKTVKCLDGVVLLDKYYTHLSYDTVGVIIAYIARLLGTTLANDLDDLPNNIRVFGTFKGYDSDNKVINYTRREICNIIASINASNAIFNAQGKLYLTIPDFSTKYVIPSSSVISYTDLNAKNKFTSIYFSDGKESSLPSKIDPQSSEYDPNIMIVNCPIDTRATKEEIETNIESIVKGVSYDGVIIKKQGTGLYEIGDVLTFSDETRNKSYNNIFVMGITYEISAQNGFTETIYSLAKSETQQQTRGISVSREVNKTANQAPDNVKVSQGGVEYGNIGVTTDDEGNSGLTIAMGKNAQWLRFVDNEGNKILEYIPKKEQNQGKNKPYKINGNLWFYPTNQEGTEGFKFANFENENTSDEFLPSQSAENPKVYALTNMTWFCNNTNYANIMREAGFTDVRDATAINGETWMMNGISHTAIYKQYKDDSVNPSLGGFWGIYLDVQNTTQYPWGWQAFFPIGQAPWHTPQEYFTGDPPEVYITRPFIAVGFTSPYLVYDNNGNISYVRAVPMTMLKADIILSTHTSTNESFKAREQPYISYPTVIGNKIDNYSLTDPQFELIKDIVGVQEQVTSYEDSLLVYKKMFLMNDSKIYNADGTEYPSNTE